MLARLRGSDRESGAVAILVLLLVLLLALPATAVGLSAHVRNGARAELQQAADAAALAGAASIPLVSTEAAVAQLLSGTPLPPPGAAAIDAACAQAVLAGRSNAQFATRFATPAGGTGCGVGGGTGPTSAAGFVTADFIPDSDAFTATADCLEFIGDNFAGPVPDEPTQPVFYTAAGAARGLASVLPLILRRGVQVQTRQMVQGPLDPLVGSVLGGTVAPREQRTTSRAVRRVKNLVVLPVVEVAGNRVSLSPTVGSVTGTVPESLDAAADLLGTSAGDVLPDGLEATVSGVISDGPLGPVLGPVVDPVLADALDFSVPRSCTAVLEALADDYRDVVDPRDNPRTQSEIVEDAVLNGEGVKVLLLGPDATLLDLVDVCFGDPPVSEVVPTVFEVLDEEGFECATEAPGSLRATLVR